MISALTSSIMAYRRHKLKTSLYMEYRQLCRTANEKTLNRKGGSHNIEVGYITQ